MTGDKGGGDRPPADPPERTLLQSSGMELSSMAATPSLEPPVSHSLWPPLRSHRKVCRGSGAPLCYRDYHVVLGRWARGRRGRLRAAGRGRSGWQADVQAVRASAAQWCGAARQSSPSVAHQSAGAHTRTETHTHAIQTQLLTKCVNVICGCGAMCASVCDQGGDATLLATASRSAALIGGGRGGRSQVAARRFVSFQDLSKCFAFCARSAILHTPLAGAGGGGDGVMLESSSGPGPDPLPPPPQLNTAAHMLMIKT